MLRFPLSLHAEPSTRSGRRCVRLDGSDDAVITVQISDGTEAVSLASVGGRALCFPVQEISLFKGAAQGVIAIKLDAGDRLFGAVLTRADHRGLTVTTPQGREEIIRPRKYLSSRAARGRSVLKRGGFKPLAPVLTRYDLMYQQPQEGEE